MPRTRHVIRFKRREFPFHYVFEAYGVRVGVSTNTREAMRAIEERIANLLPEFELLETGADVDHRFFYVWNASGRDSFYKNGDAVWMRRSRDAALGRLGTEIRLTVAEYAKDRIFVHAGVVRWNNKAIVMPASSFDGKTTLTAEFVRRGAVYYSDEYAVFDRQGKVHPFPKQLSLRGVIDRYRQVDRSVESLGGVAGEEPAPVGMVLITAYRPKARWRPIVLNPAKGVMEIIKHTLPIRRDPPAALEVLSALCRSTPVVKTMRGDAAEFVDKLIEYLEADPH